MKKALIPAAMIAGAVALTNPAHAQDSTRTEREYIFATRNLTEACDGSFARPYVIDVNLARDKEFNLAETLKAEDPISYSIHDAKSELGKRIRNPGTDSKNPDGIEKSCRTYRQGLANVLGTRDAESIRVLNSAISGDGTVSFSEVYDEVEGWKIQPGTYMAIAQTGEESVNVLLYFHTPKIAGTQTTQRTGELEKVVQGETKTPQTDTIPAQTQPKTTADTTLPYIQPQKPSHVIDRNTGNVRRVKSHDRTSLKPMFGVYVEGSSNEEAIVGASLGLGSDVFSLNIFGEYDVLQGKPFTETDTTIVNREIQNVNARYKERIDQTERIFEEKPMASFGVLARLGITRDLELEARVGRAVMDTVLTENGQSTINFYVNDPEFDDPIESNTIDNQDNPKISKGTGESMFFGAGLNYRVTPNVALRFSGNKTGKQWAGRLGFGLRF